MPQISSKNHHAIVSFKLEFSQISRSSYFFPAKLEQLLAEYPTDLNTFEDNQNAAYKAFDKYIISTDDEDALPLKALDIPESQQNEFITALHTKYGLQFSEQEVFKNYIQQEFNLSGRDYAHALKLAHFGLEDLLNAAKQSHIGPANFFSSRTVRTRFVPEPSYSSTP